MLITQKGSPDGIQVVEYKEGEVYELPLSLALVFLDHGWAEEDKSLDIPEKKEEKIEKKKSKKK